MYAFHVLFLGIFSQSFSHFWFRWERKSRWEVKLDILALSQLSDFRVLRWKKDVSRLFLASVSKCHKIVNKQVPRNGSPDGLNEQKNKQLWLIGNRSLGNGKNLIKVIEALFWDLSWRKRSSNFQINFSFCFSVENGDRKMWLMSPNKWSDF